MFSEDEISRLVRRMVEAENQGGKSGSETLDSILAPDFFGLTRSSGKEESRADLLESVANSADQTIVREVSGFEVMPSDDLAFVRSVVTVRDSTDPRNSQGRFRNTNFFRRDGGSWLCVSWQVTRLA